MTTTNQAAVSLAPPRSPQNPSSSSPSPTSRWTLPTPRLRPPPPPLSPARSRVSLAAIISFARRRTARSNSSATRSR
eukprot:31256-Pelagococcus_subviridis.AAC.5